MKDFDYTGKFTPRIEENEDGFSIYDLLTDEQKAIVDAVYSETPEKVLPSFDLSNLKKVEPIDPLRTNQSYFTIGSISRRPQVEGK